MALPRKPERSSPIPNQPFESPEVTTIRGPYWDMPLGPGLEADGYGSVQTTGSTSSDPSAYLYGSNGFVGVGTGLQLGPNGELEQSGGEYIYCTPQYSNLPVTYPPYGCETEVNTAGVTDFTNAWQGCTFFDFPCVDSSSVIDFSLAWHQCVNITSFPTINTSVGETFTYTWSYSGLTSFPLLDIRNGNIFYGAWMGCQELNSFPTLDFSAAQDLNYCWYGCSTLTNFTQQSFDSGDTFRYTWGHCAGLVSFPVIDCGKGTDFFACWIQCTNLVLFPSLDFSSAVVMDNAWAECTNLGSFPYTQFPSAESFYGAWVECHSLTSFPAGVFDNCKATNFRYAWQNCALSQQSVDNILVSLGTAGQSNGIVNIDGGTSAAPSATGLAAKASLEAKGWTVTTN